MKASFYPTEEKKMSERKKCYLVISKDKKYTYGAFEFTPEGKKKANSYAKKLGGENGNFLVVEK